MDLSIDEDDGQHDNKADPASNEEDADGVVVDDAVEVSQSIAEGMQLLKDTTKSGRGMLVRSRNI